MAKKSAFTPRAIQSDDTIYHIKVTLIGGPITQNFISANPEPPFRIIAIKAGQTLEDLHYAIFEAFDRFDMHMYEFQLGCKKPMAHDATRYGYVPDDDEMYFFDDADMKDAVSTSLNSLNLKIKEPFFYWFDFGDDWMHELQLIGTSQSSGDFTYPLIIDKKGESPPQYPDYESEENAEPDAAQSRKELPPEDQARIDEINKLVRDFCHAHLNEGYLAACESVFSALRSTWLDWRRGAAAGWAAGVAHATAAINFLHSMTSEPHMKLADIAHDFSISKATMENRSRQIRDALDALPLDPRFCIPENLKDNPLATLAILSGGARGQAAEIAMRKLEENAPKVEDKRAKPARKRKRPKKR